MKNLSKLIIAAMIALLAFSKINAQTAKVKGSVKISTKTGKIECNFIASNLPYPKSYDVFLDSSLTVKPHIHNLSGSDYYVDVLKNPSVCANCTGYTFPAVRYSELDAPNSIKISYVGVVDAQSKGAKQNIREFLFNHSYYPVIYDNINEMALENVEFDVTYICEDCKETNFLEEMLSKNESK